jgi:hypothetical protein
MRLSFLFSIFVSATATVMNDGSGSPTHRVDVFNVTVAPEGLVIPFTAANNSDHIINAQLISQYYLGTMRIHEITRYPLIDNIPHIQRPFVDGAPEPGYQHLPAPAAVAAEDGPQVSIADQSPMSDYYRRALLTPLPEGGFQLIAGLADPMDYCVEGSIARAQLSYPLSFHIGISLMPNPNRPLSSDVATTPTSDFCEINTSRHKDAIPAEVYDALIAELEALSGGAFAILNGRPNLNTLNYTDLIPQMPSLHYTIYRSDSGAVPVSVITLLPEDYVSLNPDGSFELQVEPGVFVPELGINFLRNVAIYLNYAEHQIGFCDPI